MNAPEARLSGVRLPVLLESVRGAGLCLVILSKPELHRLDTHGGGDVRSRALEATWSESGDGIFSKTHYLFLFEFKIIYNGRHLKIVEDR